MAVALSVAKPVLAVSLACRLVLVSRWPDASRWADVGATPDDGGLLGGYGAALARAGTVNSAAPIKARMASVETARLRTVDMTDTAHSPDLIGAQTPDGPLSISKLYINARSGPGEVLTCLPANSQLVAA